MIIYLKNITILLLDPAMKADERKAIEREISYITNKYSSSFRDTLCRKVEQKVLLSGEEEQDTDEWEYWLKRLGLIG
ncbi:hypothetical protein AYW79_12615 [Ferroacidibacillus organovorans]|uniref:Uncharacterized protein n=1 Tax=Ferroacidibacillus organovorans TaxID=1765683 RepID=A0A853KCB8_9BACL|nr:hypothetical protein AYJ22_12790 [Ferroacidibacillus organovorans]OAG93048.1 hypothetical protein AYW79_12615 [Ferroacidibacillus organovorans]